MPLFTPMVGEVAGRVLDHPDPNRTEFAGAPSGGANFAGMLGRLDSGPVCGAKREIGDLHARLLTSF